MAGSRALHDLPVWADKNTGCDLDNLDGIPRLARVSLRRQQMELEMDLEIIELEMNLCVCRCSSAMSARCTTGLGGMVGLFCLCL